MSFKINKILTLFLITGCLFAQTITNVQARQKGLDIIITYDMAGMLDREQTPGLKTMDQNKVLIYY